MGLLSAPWSLLPSGTFLTMLALFFSVFALILDVMKRRRSCSRYPPGPSSLPFVGNILEVDFKSLTKYCSQLRKTYGDVFSVQFCWENVVIINGLKSVKEGLIAKSDDTSDRPPDILSKIAGFKEDSSGCPFDPNLMINSAVSNVICSIVFGDRFKYDDKTFLKVLAVFEDLIKSSNGLLAQLMNVIPALIHVPGVASDMARSQNNIFDFLRDIITEHKKTYDPNMKRDFIDAFLEEAEKEKGDPNSSFCEQNLLLTVADLFTAGTATTATTLRFGLLYMILYPDIQTKVQEEIDQVIGRERQPTMDDRASMPYTNAVVHEIQRCSDIVPLGVPHKTSRDTEVNGFNIPKGTTLMFNMSSVLKDESIWERPYQFYPEHFLDADGQFIKREAFMPFSAGRRVCLGEQLARMELFLFFTIFLQQLTFSVPRKQPRPSEAVMYCTFRSPPPYQLCAEVR
ncbi:cytochrome P450 2D4-like isoform X2 [Lissotriton helveticus]